MTKSCFQVNIGAFDEFVKKVSDDPSHGKVTFKTTTEWQGGAISKTTARDFVFKTDEPKELGGTDTGADPVELLLASIATCLSIGLVTHAAKKGIEFEDFVIETEGDLDLRGYFGLDQTIRPGYTDIRYTVKVKSDASKEELEEIKEMAHKLSPMVETVVNGVNVKGSIEKM
ncbi:MAG: OsmC family protein [Bacillaceae bacterium]|nr:OsmC family protein [Bacillaceae bacterium]